MELAETEHKYDQLIDGFKKAAKVVGIVALCGATGYAAAKGLEQMLPIDEGGLFEGVVVGTYAAMGAYTASEVL